MAKKTTSVDGAPQEEVAQNTVKKTRSPRKSPASSSKTKRPSRSLKKEKTEVPAPTAMEETPVTVLNEELKENDQQVAVSTETSISAEESITTKAVAAANAPEMQVKAPEMQVKAPEMQVKAQPSASETQAKAPAVSTETPAPTQEPSSDPAPQPKQAKPERKPQPIPPLPNIVINDIIELANAPKAGICLNDQQIQQLTLEEATRRFQYLEYTLANILDYDIVLSDTNIWLELLIGHTSSHSDPRVNARLQFERQLEFISKLTKHRGGRFMMMSETYEEIDRFATAQEPTNYRDADWTDEALCRNVAARLAKRLILSQQRENRLRIEGIGAESHHAAFADPAIIRRTVEMFSQGRKVLLLTNDASVAIRSMGMCDDLQRHNRIDDRTWDAIYAPLRPMVMTMDDLKLLDNYTRQYHFLQVAAGMSWMQDIPKLPVNRDPKPTSPVYGGSGNVPQRKNLALWEEGFRPGDRHERHSDQQARQKEQQKQKEAERQRQAELQKQKEAERQRQAEQQKQKEAEQQRQREAERQRQEEQRRLQSERDRARQQEINRQKELEAQRQREAEAQRCEAQREAEQQRQAELQREEEAKRQAELDAQRQAELQKAELQRQVDIERKRIAEQKKQKKREEEAKEQVKELVKELAKEQATTEELTVPTQEPSLDPATDMPAEETKKRPSRRGGGRGRSTKSNTSRSKKTKEA